MNLPDAARELGLSPGTLRVQIKLGRLRAYRMGGRWYVRDEEIARYRRESLRDQPKDGVA